MSWLYSRALVEEYSAVNSSAGELSAQSRTTHMQQAYLLQGKTTAAWARFPSGMMCGRLTVGRGEELLTSFLAGFHAKISAPPVGGPELVGPVAGSGWKWPGSFVKFDPGTSSWKTRQCLLLGGSERYSETWPRWGMMRNGECLVRTTWAPPTKGIESGSLPLFPTPIDASKGGGTSRSGNRRSECPTLHGMARHNRWPTPRASDSDRGGRGELLHTVKTGHPRAWPTPRASPNENRQTKPSPSQLAGRHGMNLAAAVNLWRTPTAHNAKECNAPSERERNTPTLAAQAGGSLNPTWVEWLMGWPLGHTDCDASETDKYQQWQQWHGSFCPAGSRNKETTKGR